MTENIDIDGPRFGPEAGKADALVILLHGLGADGNDLIGLAPHWAPALPDVAFVSPHAPFPCDMAPFGRQWFSLLDRRPEPVLQGVMTAAPILDRFIDRELERYGLEADRLALVGFSQGTMMSLYVAPRRPAACAGVVGYSGRLIGDATLPEETRSRPPVLLVHGTADEIVPFDSLEHGRAGLEAADFKVETLTRPGLGHGIDEEALIAGGRFLHEKLKG